MPCPVFLHALKPFHLYLHLHLVQVQGSVVKMGHDSSL